MIKLRFVIIILTLNNTVLNATTKCKNITSLAQCELFNTEHDSQKNIFLLEINNQPNPVIKLFKKKHRLNKRISAAVLAFPFPFGIVGLHRIYLGTDPHVPVVYIASLGGVFGILPLIDFIAITTDRHFDQYKNNGKVLMWVKD